MGKGENIDSDVGIDKCLSCVSTCCKLKVDLTKNEYACLKKLGFEDFMENNLENFLDKNPFYKDERKRDYVENLFIENDDYATLLKSEDGFCSLLDKKTRLCSIYENRPKVCKDFSNQSKRCEYICLN